MTRTKYEYDAAQDETGVWRVRHLHGHGCKGFSYTSKHASEDEARATAAAVKAMTDRQIFDARERARPDPINESSSYRAAMIDAGRERLLR